MSLLSKLVILFVTQLGLIFFLWKPSQLSEVGRGQEALLGFDISELKSIKISEASTEENMDRAIVALDFAKQENGQWVMPKHDEFPVAEEKLAKVLSTLGDLRRGWPVGKTDIAAKALQVSEENYEKKIELTAGEKSQTLYLGSSPGFRKVHARVDGESKTWSIVLNTWDFPIDASDWRDGDVYGVSRSDVQALTFAGPGVTVVKTEQGFELQSMVEGRELDAAAVNTLLRTALSPKFDDLYNKALPKDAQIWAEWDVAFLQDGQEMHQKFQVWSSADEEDLILKSSQHPWFFTVSRATLADVKNLTQDSLLKPLEKTVGDEASIPDEPSDKADS